MCVARYKLVASKPAFLHHLWSKQNYQALFVYRSDLRQNLCNFYPILPIILQLFHRIFLQLQITLIQFRVIEAHASLGLAQQLIKMKTTLNIFVWRIQLLDRTVQSSQSILLCSMQGNNRLWAETFEKILVVQFPKSPFQPATSDFCCQKIKGAKCSVNCWVLEWTVPANRYMLHNNKKSIY